MAKKKSKIIQVPMPEDLLGRLDALASQRELSRSHVIRDAVGVYMARISEDATDDLYEEAYRRIPEQTEAAWRDKNAAEVWGAEDFSTWE